MKKIKFSKFVKNPLKLIRPLGSRNFFNWMPDKPYLELLYKSQMDQNLDLVNPTLYNEKLQWLKLYDRNPLYTDYVDKYKVRNHISNTIGENYLIPLINVYDSVNEINWDELPNKFVLKCTHGSGTNIICKDKKKLNIEEAKKNLNKWMKTSWYWFGREWPYKGIKPKIICEKFMLDEEGDQLKDFRFFCFNGEPKFVAVDFNILEKSRTRRNLYDLDWNLLDAGISYPRNLEQKVEKPMQLSEMINLAKKISKNIPHVRVDFYSIGSDVYFGEMTFYHQVGLGRIYPREFEKKMGDWIKLPN
jgi:hypothetical protein